MTTISLVATDQLLSVAIRPKVASGDQNSVKLHVDFDSKWDNYAKSAVFYTEDNGTIYEMVLTDGNCVIPHEVLAKPGILYIGIRGVNADNNAIKTSSLVKYKIAEGAPVGDGTTVEPTADVYQQILTAYKVDRARVDNLIAMRGDANVVEHTEPFSFEYAVGNCIFISNGNSVLVKINFETAFIEYETDVVICNIPEAFRPLHTPLFFYADSERHGYAHIWINNDSTLLIRSGSVDDLDCAEFVISYPLKNTVIPELADLRIDSTGETHGVAGDAVRTNISDLKEELNDAWGYINSNSGDIQYITEKMGQVLESAEGLSKLSEQMANLTGYVDVVYGVANEAKGNVDWYLENGATKEGLQAAVGDVESSLRAYIDETILGGAW